MSKNILILFFQKNNCSLFSSLINYHFCIIRVLFSFFQGGSATVEKNGIGFRNELCITTTISVKSPVIRATGNEDIKRKGLLILYNQRDLSL